MIISFDEIPPKIYQNLYLAIEAIGDTAIAIEAYD